MAVIGGHHWQVFALCQFKEAVVDDGLLLEAVVLQLEVEIVFVKFRVLPCDPAGLVHVARQDGLGYFALDAGCQTDDALGIFLKNVPVHARFIEEALKPALGHHFHKVVVAGHVLREQDQVVAALGVLALGVQVIAAGIDLTAENGLDAEFRAGLLEGGRSEHVPVVCDGAGPHTVVFRLLAQVLEADGAVKHAVFGMAVEMDKIGHAAPPAAERGCPPA